MDWGARSGSVRRGKGAIFMRRGMIECSAFRQEAATFVCLLLYSRVHVASGAPVVQNLTFSVCTRRV